MIPGQLLAVSTSSEDSFLRGHGTYLQRDESECDERGGGGGRIQLRASVAGTVVRVNRLISVQSAALHAYEAQVGDLVVGRVASIGGARWAVDLGDGATAQLPLSGAHLPGSAQRVRTAADALGMRQHLREGDLVSAEVHKVPGGAAGGGVLLHTRSARYGKLENGVASAVPAGLVPRRKTHYTTVCGDSFQILLGCNGMIWMQRNSPDGDGGGTGAAQPLAGQHELAEDLERRRAQHAETPYSLEDRRNLARLKCAVECLRRTVSEITPEAVEEVYEKSERLCPTVPEMLLPQNVIHLTAGRRGGPS